MSRSEPTLPSEFGLLAWLEETRIQLPLRKVDCRFDVTGEFTTVELVQVFQQTAAQSLDITYSFPLPANAAVYRCELTINERVIKAVVMEQKKAAKLMKEKKAEGRRTGLVQMERDNLFTLDLGNAPPGDSIEVRFAYLQVLDRLDSTLSLSIPFTPGVRYVPGKPLVRSNRGLGAVDDTDQVPDASRISPPRIDADHPDMAELYIEGRLTTGEVDLATMSSPTHPVILKKEGEHISVRLATGTDIPNRDFVVRWDELSVDVAATRAWSCRHGDETYALLQVRAPREVSTVMDGPQDVYFLIDRSGSMDGVKWEKCAAALKAFVGELGPDDRVWITFFESSFEDFAEKPMSRTDILADANFRRIEDLGTAGGTELLPALKHVNAELAGHSKGRKARIVLITDGQVGNEQEVQRLAGSQAHIPIYCFGIDTAVNDAVLRNLASRTHGRCALMTPDDDITGAVAKLARALRQPVLTGIELSGDLKRSNTDARFPELCAGETSVVAIRCGKDDARVEVAGILADGSPWRTSFDLHPDDTCQAPRLAWARQRLENLLAADDTTEAVKVACEHNVVCKGTSFVVIDEAEKVPVAQRGVYQPVAGVSMMSAPDPVLCPPAFSLREAGGESYSLRSPGKRADSTKRIEHIERQARALAREVSSRHRHAFQSKLAGIDGLSRDLQSWFTGLYLFPDWLAEALVEIVRDWMLEQPDPRIMMVQSWVHSPPSIRNAEHLMKFLEANLTGEHRNHAVELLEQALLLQVGADDEL